MKKLTLRNLRTKQVTLVNRIQRSRKEIHWRSKKALNWEREKLMIPT